ncbi:MAG: type II toxin-antitoxin system PemK/MazF family toxin [Chloroflexota bacterium]
MKPGEVWQVNLDEAFGGFEKSHPWVIVNHNNLGRLPLKIVVPLTEWKDAFAAAAWLIPIESLPENGLQKKSAADTFRIRSLPDDRFVEKLGSVSHEDLARIKVGLSVVLDLKP